jgi:hypothetical protein
MAEWLTLLLLIPAIIVPVALLLGFAGCDRVFGLTDVTLLTATIDSATGKDGTTITLVWESNGTPPKYQFERTDPDGNIANFDAPAPAAPFDDTGLAPGTSYRYRVRAIDSSGDPHGWSPPVTGTTLVPFASTYAKTLTEDGSGWEGYTLVQRIEAAYLAATGPHVRISVQASSVSDASIDRIYISQANSTGNPYDSAADLTLVYDSAANQQQPFVVPAGTTKSLPIVTYTINRFQPLLIAVDFAAAPASGVEFASSVQTSEATAYFLATPAGEAAVGTRSPNYQQAGDIGTSDVVFITNVEVG